MIEIRNVDPSYLRFLRQFDPHIPLKDERPWLWPVTIDGIEYGIPCTSQDTAAGYIGYLRYGTLPQYGLYLRYMVPVPPKALLPARPLTPELARELRLFEENRKYIEAEAQILHRLTGQGQMDRMFMSHCCDFNKLESVFFNWQPGFEAGLFLYPKKEVQDMPISKSGKVYYTKEQYEAARYNSSALEYALKQGYELVRQGNYFTMKEHDSMVFTPQGTWFWNSRGVHGTALEFQMYYENKTLAEAVLTLSGDREQSPPRFEEREKPPVPEKTNIPLQLPPKAANFRLLFSYLCGARGLEPEVVKEMIRQNRLYQSAYRRPNGKQLSNAVFVYRDPEGNAVGAFQRGMIETDGTPPYKRDVAGSDKRWGWLLTGQGSPQEVAVFEGSIDAASDASLAAMKDGTAWRNIDRLSTEGLSFQPLQNYLQTHPNVKKVVLMYDGDQPGREAAAKHADVLRKMGYEVEDRVPPFGKDWNEVLKDLRAMEAEAMALPEQNFTRDCPEM